MSKSLSFNKKKMFRKSAQKAYKTSTSNYKVSEYKDNVFSKWSDFKISVEYKKEIESCVSKLNI